MKSSRQHRAEKSDLLISRKRRTRRLVAWVPITTLLACSHQDTQQQLLDWKSSNRLPTAQPVSQSHHTGRFTIGPQGRHALLLVEWNAVRDSTDCTRIGDVKVGRTGGSPQIVISDVRLLFVPCGIPVNPASSGDTTRREVADIALKYSTRIGIRSYTGSGPVAQISSLGGITALRSDAAVEPK
jgi:hypothetical protein